MKRFLGFLWMLGGVALAVYVAVFVLLINGITDVINGAKHNPVQAGKIAWGAVQIVPLAELVGWGIFICFGAVAMAVGLRERQGKRGRGLFSGGGTQFPGSGRWPHF